LLSWGGSWPVPCLLSAPSNRCPHLPLASSSSQRLVLETHTPVSSSAYPLVSLPFSSPQFPRFNASPIQWRSPLFFSVSFPPLLLLFVTSLYGLCACSIPTPLSRFHAPFLSFPPSSFHRPLTWQRLHGRLPSGHRTGISSPLMDGPVSPVRASMLVRLHTLDYHPSFLLTPTPPVGSPSPDPLRVVAENF